MFEVIGSKATLVTLSLDEAMHAAKVMNEFVTIKGPDVEVCGKFGVDAVESATLPDGNEYTWTMRRDETHRSWKKKST